ncbi:RDD family protein [Salinibacillus xinjiangensis]|uniref:RDD family protein n=1 Tax=Salinibacillus xinjiangensis TaxID=1229268 RepID=A0A6G1X962_9BACI|nr:RDD family protein [Salinibacillus xinjiangensis]MRG87482.1 RDD family protein [Salinibacillus xinjiangensis]
MDQEHVNVKTPEYVSLQFKLAGLGSRTAAFLIDQLILMVINIAIILILIFGMGNGGSATSFLANMSSMPVAIAIILVFLLNWGYFFAFEYFSGGRTVGKKLMGIRVIQDNGHSLTLLSSFIRNLLRIIDSLPANYLLGIIMIFFHSKHKRLGDLVGGTIVVHERGKRKARGVEKIIQSRGLSETNLHIEEWMLRKLNTKDWKLLKTYAERFPEMPFASRRDMTRQLAEILLPKVGLEVPQSVDAMENKLLVLYAIMRDEWEFEL